MIGINNMTVIIWLHHLDFSDVFGSRYCCALFHSGKEKEEQTMLKTPGKLAMTI
jgi:hypothetical protein